MPLEDTNAPAVEESPGIRSLSEALRAFFFVLKWVMLGTIVFFLFSGVFIVEQQKVGLILRFGKITGPPGRQVLGPGLHWALPYPVHEVVEIEAGRVRQIEVKNFWHREDVSTVISEEKGEAPGEEGTLVPGRDGYSLSADVNVVHFKWTARYKVGDALEYFLNVAKPIAEDAEEKPEETPADEVEALVTPFVEAALASAVVDQAGRMTIDDILTTRRGEFRDAVQDAAGRILDEMKTGISLVQLDLVVKVPSVVEAAFNNVFQARMQKSSKINAAEAYKNKTIHEAEGESARIRQEGMGYKKQIISSAQADADYIETLLGKYTKDTKSLDVYLRQYHIEVLDEVLCKVRAKYVVHSGKEQEGKLWLMFSKDPKDLEPEEEERK